MIDLSTIWQQLMDAEKPVAVQLTRAEVDELRRQRDADGGPANDTGEPETVLGVPILVVAEPPVQRAIEASQENDPRPAV